MSATQEETAMTTDSARSDKIKTPFAKVIVEKIQERPYYLILYFNPADKDFHIKFGSYRLDYVFEWLEEEFEIVEDGSLFYLPFLPSYIPTSRDSVEQIHSRWITVVETNGKEYSKCANCQMELDGLEDAYSFCPYCGAKMDDKDINVPTKSGMEEEYDG